MLTMNESMFQEIVNTGRPLVVLVSAEWCMPCRSLKQILPKIEKTYSDRVKFYSVDSDTCQNLCGSLHISGIPTLLFIVGSKVAGRMVGVNSEEKIKEHIEELFI